MSRDLVDYRAVSDFKTLLDSLRQTQPIAAIKVQQWISDLPTLTDSGRARMLRWAVGAGLAAEPAITPWISNWRDKTARRQAVVAVFDGVPQAVDVSANALPILFVAAKHGESGEAAARILQRLHDESQPEPQDIETLAAEIMPVALASPAPEVAIRDVVRYLLNPDMPVLDRGMWKSVAGMTVSKARPRTNAATVAEEFRDQRREAGSLRRTAHWQQLVRRTSGIWEDADELLTAPELADRHTALHEVITERDLDELIEACDQPMTPAERSLILGSVIAGFANTRDPRLTAAHLERVRQLLNRHLRLPPAGPPPRPQRQPQGQSQSAADSTPGRPEPPAGGPQEALWSYTDLYRIWMLVAHDEMARQFLEDYRRTGFFDQGVWHSLYNAANHHDATQLAAWCVTVRDLCHETLRQETCWILPFYEWLHRAPDDGARMIFEEIDVARDALSPRALAVLAGVYQSVATPRAYRFKTYKPARVKAEALARLEIIATRTDEAGAAAVKALQILGVGAQAPIEALAAEWRTTKSPDSLRRFFRTYIQVLDEGTPFARWRKRLGAPHEGDKNYLCYRALDGDDVYEIYLHLNHGALYGWQEGPR